MAERAVPGGGDFHRRVADGAAGMKNVRQGRDSRLFAVRLRRVTGPAASLAVAPGVLVVAEIADHGFVAVKDVGERIALYDPVGRGDHGAVMKYDRFIFVFRCIDKELFRHVGRYEAVRVVVFWFRGCIASGVAGEAGRVGGECRQCVMADRTQGALLDPVVAANATVNGVKLVHRVCEVESGIRIVPRGGVAGDATLHVLVVAGGTGANLFFVPGMVERDGGEILAGGGDGKRIPLADIQPGGAAHVLKVLYLAARRRVAAGAEDADGSFRVPRMALDTGGMHCVFQGGNFIGGFLLVAGPAVEFGFLCGFPVIEVVMTFPAVSPGGIGMLLVFQKVYGRGRPQ